jgi:hypothetical protein
LACIQADQDISLSSVDKLACPWCEYKQEKEKKIGMSKGRELNHCVTEKIVGYRDLEGIVPLITPEQEESFKSSAHGSRSLSSSKGATI